MMQSITSKALVLYNRNFREDDKLVKIFTEQAGKRMFFVKHATNSKLSPVIQPLTLANLLMKVNDDGLSYIQDYQDVQPFTRINSDLFIMAYATYVAALADASIPDSQPDAALFAFLTKTLELMEDGLDHEILTNIFEVQILSRFGVSLNFHECVFCHRTGLPLIFPLNSMVSSVQTTIMKTIVAVIFILISHFYLINFRQWNIALWKLFH